VLLDAVRRGVALATSSPREVAGATPRCSATRRSCTLSRGPALHEWSVDVGVEGRIVSVVWYEQSRRIEVHYFDTEPDYLEGDEQIVREMAEDEGMCLVSTEDGIRGWVRP